MKRFRDLFRGLQGKSAGDQGRAAAKQGSPFAFELGLRVFLWSGGSQVLFTNGLYTLDMSHRVKKQSPVHLGVEQVTVAALIPHERNARTHSKRQVAQIARSIEEFGFNNPVLVDAKNKIIAGHGRVEAARSLGLETVPAIRLEHLSETQLRAYVIADNRLAELAGWDQEMLAIELQGLIDLLPDFDVTLTGFEMGDIDVLLRGIETTDGDRPDPDDTFEGVDRTKEAVTKLGDVWAIGPHRLICGDSTEAATYQRLLGKERAQMVFTDPPYNVPIGGHVSGLGKVKHAEFAMASGEMSEDQFTGFLGTIFERLVAFSQDGSIHFVCMDWRHMNEVLVASRGTYALQNLCVWTKTNGGMGSLYRSQHELVFVLKSGSASHINNVELGRHGRNRTNVWSYAGINSFGAHRDSDLSLHPTVKPVALVADAILDCSNRKGIILDAFAGSGSTLVAAHRTGRRGYGIELDPHYCDVILRRLQKIVRQDPILEGSGKRFVSRGQRKPRRADRETSATV